MDELGFRVLFDNISVISGGWFEDNERKSVCIRALFFNFGHPKFFLP